MSDEQFAAILAELVALHRRKQQYRDELDALDRVAQPVEARRLARILQGWVNEVHGVERSVEVIFGRKERDRLRNAAYDAVYPAPSEVA
jgi:hypothetical protein